MRETVVTRVARGAQLLDDERPGWHKQVDMAGLRMNDGDACILGQAFKDAVTSYDGDGFAAGMRGLSLDEANVSKYGFDVRLSVGPHNEADEYDRLAYQWQRQIGRRLVKEGKALLK